MDTAPPHSYPATNTIEPAFLVDGTVQAEGIDLEILSLPVGERHRAVFRDLEFDVCELQMGVFLGWIGRGASFSAIPVFPHRKFCSRQRAHVMPRAAYKRPASCR